MNIALVFAGGTGQRMNTASKPKQFLELHGKPILAYTLEVFDKHPLINGIIVVCLQEWIPVCRKMIEHFHIDKVEKIVPGGVTGQESIFNGLKAAVKLYSENSIVLIHDGVRPLINESVISYNIECVKRNGNAITVLRIFFRELHLHAILATPFRA